MPDLENIAPRFAQLTETDLDDFALLTANEGFMQFSGTGPIDREQSAAMLERIMLRTRVGQPALFAVVDPFSEKLIGYLSLIHI